MVQLCFACTTELCASSSVSTCVVFCRHGPSPGVISQGELVHDNNWAVPPPGPIDDLLVVCTQSIYQSARNTLDCDQSNVYSPRIIFSSISLNLPFHFLSLFTVGRRVTLPCEVSV